MHNKKPLRIFASLLVTLLSFFIMLAPNASAAVNSDLRFESNGEFKILIVADTQDTDEPQKEMLRLLEASLDKAQPDLVVLLGDNIHGPAVIGVERRAAKAIDCIVQPIVERNIPFALVFGNHDDESGVSKEYQMNLYRSYEGCLASDEDPTLTGCGNYNLVVKSSDGSRDALNLWFLDSGTYEDVSHSGYGNVAADQLEWYKDESAALAKRNGSKPVPSFVFQHIPVPEVCEMLSEVPQDTENAVEMNGKYYVANPQFIREGSLGEAPCPSSVNSGEFDVWKSCGDVVAAFFGHDHVNDYVGELDGIDLVATAGCGFFIYGNGDDHGTRLITVSENSPEDYKTEMLYYKDIVQNPSTDEIISTKGAMFMQCLIVAVILIVLLLVFLVFLVRHIIKKRRLKKIKTARISE